VVREQVWYRRNHRFQEELPMKATQEAAAVIGFNAASWVLAQQAIKLDKPFILDQTAPPAQMWYTIRRGIMTTFPEWKVDRASEEFIFSEVEKIEHGLATRIVVASSYAKELLIHAGVDADKILINPYGVNLEIFHYIPRTIPGHGVRFLFVGGLFAHKGIPLLFETWRTLDRRSATLSLIGFAVPAVQPLIPSLPGLRLWNRVPHKDLPAVYQAHDVFVLPSYADAFGLVILEAMACGLPVITTQNTAGPDLITSGIEGFIIPAGDMRALRDAMQFFVDSPERIPVMGAAARKVAKQYTWDSYGDRWAAILKEVCRC
jgi:starch synthase